MRNALGGYFVLGFMVPCLGLWALLLFKFTAGHSMTLEEMAATFTGAVLLYWLGRLLAGWLTASHVRSQRPHELFTPLYEKRPHEWTCRIA